MNSLYDYLKNHPIVYVTRDIERAFSIESGTQGYYIITNKSEEGLKYKRESPENILLLGDGKKLLDTHELLSHTDTKKYLDNLSTRPNILVFKNTIQIEKIAKENNWNLLNPSAALANSVEEKVEQTRWLGNLAHYLPSHSISKLKEINFENTPFILQFNHAHSGEGTLFIEKKEDLEKVKKTFPEREVRKVEYIKGPILTGNNIVTKEKILIGNLNYQITGHPSFTDLPFATVGNDFSLPKKILSPSQLLRYGKLTEEVGNRLRSAGWKGLFGIDFVMGDKTGELYLIEINARQSASVSFESTLQMEIRKKEKRAGVTVFEAHLMSLFNLHFSDDLVIVREGAQILQRITKRKGKISKKILDALAKLGFSLVLYENSNLNSELLRIQNKEGIMERHGSFNSLGKKIVEILS